METFKKLLLTEQIDISPKNLKILSMPTKDYLTIFLL